MWSGITAAFLPNARCALRSTRAIAAKGVCRVPAKPTNALPPGFSSRERPKSFVRHDVLSANCTSKKVRINLANAIDIGRNRDALKARASKRAPPLLGSQKAWIRPNLWICLNICKTLKNLKHQLRIDWLIEIGAQAFADHEPPVASQSRSRFAQTKQEIPGDMHKFTGYIRTKSPGFMPLVLPGPMTIHAAHSSERSG